MDPALFKAATLGSVASLMRLLDPKDPIILSSTTPQLNTALHLAASHGHAKFAGRVLELKEELLVAQNADGDTPLHLAARAGRLEVAELLVRHALSLSWPQDKESPLVIVNGDGNTALHEAVRHRRSSVAVALLEADPSRGHDLISGRVESLLDMAAREGLVQVVDKIVSIPRVAQDEFLPGDRVTALHQAVLGSHNEIVETLLEKRPDLIDRTDSDGNNALHYAARRHSKRVVKLLLKQRTKLVYKVNKTRLSPLHIAAQYGSPDAIKALLLYCPDVTEMVDDHSRNAFHVAAASGKGNALRYLLRHVRPVELLNRIDSNGDTPLLVAAKMMHIHCRLLLLEDRSVDPCVRGHDGHTACSYVEMTLTLHADETDAHELYLWRQLKTVESLRCPKQALPPTVAPTMQPTSRRRPLNDKDFDKVVDAYFLAATLIATVTFPPPSPCPAVTTRPMPSPFTPTTARSRSSWSRLGKEGTLVSIMERNPL